MSANIDFDKCRLEAEQFIAEIRAEINGLKSRLEETHDKIDEAMNRSNELEVEIWQLQRRV